jgi:hypothetical protein
MTNEMRYIFVQEHESDIEEMSNEDRRHLTTIMDAVKEYQAASITIQIKRNSKAQSTYVLCSCKLHISYG